MPDMANITVKKNDGTTDIIYTKMQPSSGDGTSAVWKATSVGTSPAHQPEMRLNAKESDAGRSRAVRTTYAYPQVATNTTTSMTSVVSRAAASTDWRFPKDMPQSDINEFVSQYANLMVSTLVKDSVKSGYAPS